MMLRTRRLLAAVSVAVLASATATVVSDPATAAAAAPLSWRPCHDGLFCANLRVPLDYDDPNGPRIALSLVKQPATDRSRRIGSLFVNPGGPGGSGVDFVVGAGQFLFTPQVRARFDIVGFDPRGIDRSTPLRCFDTEAQASRVFAPFPYPNSAKRRDRWFSLDRKLQAACTERANPILNHMSTADTARDLDRMRAAVGDAALTYYGVSYGSLLGNMYANLFPGRVRSVVIDGVLDPIAWTTGRAGEEQLPFSTRLHSAAGAKATLHEFFRLCDAGADNCAFAPHAAGSYAALFRSLAAHPIRMGAGLRYDESFLVGDTLGAMYDSSSWPGFARFLAHLRDRAAPAKLAADRAALHAPYARYRNFAEGFPGVACSDSVNPQTQRAWTDAAAQARQQDGLFGPIWTWITSVCAHWPGQDSDRYLGPFTHDTANPVLVVGNIFDPATPYQGAQAAARLLPNSRLLTVHGWAHTSLFLSRCADQAIGRYLLTSQLPATGTVCEQDVVPFQQPARAKPTTSLDSAHPFPVWVRTVRAAPRTR